MTASLYTDAHGEVQQKTNSKTKRKRDVVLLWKPLPPAGPRTHLPLTPDPREDDEPLRAERNRGWGCLPSAARPGERRVVRLQAEGTELQGHAPSRAWGGPDDCLNSTHSQTEVRGQTERLPACFLYRRKEHMWISDSGRERVDIMF